MCIFLFKYFTNRSDKYLKNKLTNINQSSLKLKNTLFNTERICSILSFFKFTNSWRKKELPVNWQKRIYLTLKLENDKKNLFFTFVVNFFENFIQFKYTFNFLFQNYSLCTFLLLKNFSNFNTKEKMKKKSFISRCLSGIYNLLYL